MVDVSNVLHYGLADSPFDRLRKTVCWPSLPLKNRNGVGKYMQWMLDPYVN